MAGYIKVKCARCGKQFERLEWRVLQRKRAGFGGPFCSHRCSALGREKSDAEHLQRAVVRALSRFIPEPNSGCWLWDGHVDRMGYAVLSIRSRFINGHRVMWEWRNGPIPKGMHVCHKCDVPSCINPDHLFLGTHADNMADKMRKGRARNGAIAARERAERATIEWRVTGAAA